MLGLLVRIKHRKRARARFVGLEQKFLGIAIVVLFGSMLAPASLPWMLVEVGGLVLITLLMAVILLPLALVIF